MSEQLQDKTIGFSFSEAIHPLINDLQHQLQFKDSPSHEYGSTQPINIEYPPYPHQVSHSYDQIYYSFYDTYSPTATAGMDNPLDIHRKSSVSTDISVSSLQPSTFIPSSSLDSHHSSTMDNECYFHNGLSRSAEDDYAIQMNMQMLMEKKRKRRESHNAVERRRRDKINDLIKELYELLPETSFLMDGQNYNKPNKGTILKKSVEHIQQLQQEITSCSRRIQELENTLKMYL